MAASKVYEPSVKDTIIRQDRKRLYFHAGCEALYRVFDVHFVKYEWMLLWSWINKTEETHSFEYTVPQTLAVTGVEAIDAQWGLRDALMASLPPIDGSTIVITENARLKEPDTRGAVTVWPNSSVHLYRKKYTLGVVMWFQLDAFSQLWTVGEPNSDDETKVETTVEMDASDYLVSSKELFGPGCIFVAPALDIKAQTDVLHRQRCTDESQKYLQDRGV